MANEEKVKEQELDVTSFTDDLAPELRKTIEEKIAEIKAKDPKVRIVFPLMVEGEEYDDKEYYLAFFRQPTFMAFSKYLTFAQKDQVVAMRTLANDCFLDGDKELIDDDSLFLFGLMGQMGKIIEMRHGKLVNLSKPGK